MPPVRSVASGDEHEPEDRCTEKKRGGRHRPADRRITADDEAVGQRDR
jgi:hypothetical protein